MSSLHLIKYSFYANPSSCFLHSEGGSSHLRKRNEVPEFNLFSSLLYLMYLFVDKASRVCQQIFSCRWAVMFIEIILFPDVSTSMTYIPGTGPQPVFPAAHLSLCPAMCPVSHLETTLSLHTDHSGGGCDR